MSASVLYIALGAVIGFVIGWLLVYSRSRSANAIAEERSRQVQQRVDEILRLRSELDSAKQDRTEAVTRLQEMQKSFEEQRALIEMMKKEMTDTFNALSSAALKSSSEDFLRLASESLGKVAADTKGKLGEHQAAMDGLVKPLKEALTRYEEQIHSIELKRKQDYTSLDEQIRHLITTHRDLQKETGNLVTALRKPHIRGRWGEITLRNVVELAGMSSHCDFTEQLSIESESGRLRPDMVIHLPGGHDIVVDSKVSMEALLDVASAQTEESKKEALKRHVQHVKEQINRLSSKAYWGQFLKSPELAVLFIGESSLVSAIELEPTLMEDSMSKKILIATPTTLFALLTAVAYGWRQEQITKNAEIIASLGKELYERMSTLTRHFSDIGSAIEKTISAYNRSIGSMETRVLPSVRRFKELGATGAEEIPIMEQIDQKPRNLTLLQDIEKD